MPGMRIRSSLTAVAAIGVLCIGMMMPAHAAAGQTNFADVPENAWYRDAVSYCVEHDLMSGTGEKTFSPDADMSRAMLATVLYHMAGNPQVDAGGQPFPDVAQGSWYFNAASWAKATGVISGYGDGTFGPDDPITREQLATVLYHMAGSPKNENGGRPFADQGVISDWALEAVMWAQSAGIISGRADGTFDPTASASRAEGASVLSAFDRIQQSNDLIEPEKPSEPSTPTQPEKPSEPVTPTEPEEPTQPDDPQGEAGPWGILTPNQYDSQAFVVENGFLTYQGDAASHVGIDVSAYQKEIDWQKVAQSGVEFAIIRTGYRGYTVGKICQDSYFTQNMEGALEAGLEVGVYFFSQAITPQEAVEEARQVLEWIEDYPVTYPVVFDWERVEQEDSRTNEIDGEGITACALAFCEEISKAGYQAMTYGSPSKVNEDLLLDQLQDYPFWLANYTPNWRPTTYQYHYQMWQYSSTGEVDGIEGHVDLNLCLTDWN